MTQIFVQGGTPLYNVRQNRFYISMHNLPKCIATAINNGTFPRSRGNVLFPTQQLTRAIEAFVYVRNERQQSLSDRVSALIREGIRGPANWVHHVVTVFPNWKIKNQLNGNIMIVKFSDSAGTRITNYINSQQFQDDLFDVQNWFVSQGYSVQDYNLEYMLTHASSPISMFETARIGGQVLQLLETDDIGPNCTSVQRLVAVSPKGRKTPTNQMQDLNFDYYIHTPKGEPILDVCATLLPIIYGGLIAASDPDANNLNVLLCIMYILPENNSDVNILILGAFARYGLIPSANSDTDRGFDATASRPTLESKTTPNPTGLGTEQRQPQSQAQQQQAQPQPTLQPRPKMQQSQAPRQQQSQGFSHRQGGRGGQGGRQRNVSTNAFHQQLRGIDLSRYHLLLLVPNNNR